MNSPPSSAPASESSDARSALRRRLRACRRELSSSARDAAGRALTRHIAATRWLRAGRAIGLYAATGTEVDTAAILALALRRGCRVYLPRIVDYRNRSMRFARLNGPLVNTNRHGILEPDTQEYLSARLLSVVFVPLLGFDAHGTRLGSGAGYYDRLFVFRHRRLACAPPLLIGLAFRCQQLTRIEAHAHDIALDAVVTEAGIVQSHLGEARCDLDRHQSVTTQRV